MEFLVFAVTAAIAIIGAVAMLLSKNAVHSALFLLLNFGAISVFYLLLRAPFLFAVQLIVYAGAIIVLFLFVVMLLGAERAEDDRDRLPWQRWAAVVLGAILAIEAIYVAMAQPAISMLTSNQNLDEYATLEEISVLLFTKFLFPLEVTGMILLVAVIGVVMLSRLERREG